MGEFKRALEPFRFFTRLHLSELTGLRATTIAQLLDLIRVVSGSCIYHHTHRFLQQHQYLSPEPPNDFAYWIANVVGDERLGEKLASIDTIQFSTIHGLRDEIITTIEGHLRENPMAKLRFAPAGEEFHFIKSISFVLPTDYLAYDLKEFCEVIRKITIDSIYYHIFEARLRLEKATNDFSLWIETSLHDKELACSIARLDPYTYTLEELRRVILKRIEYRIS